MTFAFIKINRSWSQGVIFLMLLSCIQSHATLYPQEKIYAHLDKKNYMVGEDVWFRAYLVDAQSHQPDTTSRYVYAELISPECEVLERKKIRLEEGIYQGYMPLAEELVGGTYQLRFYTRYMENMGENYFFTRIIHVESFSSLLHTLNPVFTYKNNNRQVEATLDITEKDNHKPVPLTNVKIKRNQSAATGLKTIDNRVEFTLTDPVPGESFQIEYEYLNRIFTRFVSLPATEDDFVVTFFPEGGHLPAGVWSKIAFKALNTAGMGEDISGVIVNQQGDSIGALESEHRGMGSFLHVANAEERYYAICRNEKGVEKKVALPIAKADVLTLQLFRQSGNLVLHLAGREKSGYRDPLKLRIVCRGQLIYSADWSAEKEVTLFPETRLPAGVIHLVVTDANHNPLTERLVFSNNYQKQPNMSVETSKPFYGSREEIKASIELKDHWQKPIEGNFSVSVIDRKVARTDPHQNILSTLLLSSDLKGYIESPAYYFNESNLKAGDHLDLVMLTHGWTRYETRDILSGELTASTTKREYTQQISGHLKGGFLTNKAQTNYPVSLFSFTYHFYLDTLSDKNGQFRFEDFELPEYTTYRIQAKRPPGVNKIELILDEEEFPPVSNLYPFQEKEDKMIAERITAHHFNATDALRMIELRPVTVTANAKKRGEHQLSSEFNKKYKSEDLNMIHASNMYTLLQYFPQLNVLGRSVYMSPIPTTPLILVDNMRIMSEDLIGYRPAQVKEIEIVTGAQTTIFGLEGSGGVILITMKDGEINLENTSLSHVRTITPLGYQITKEFYSPTYKTKEDMDTNPADYRSTIYWNPSVSTGEDGKAEISFYASDSPENYLFLVEGITEEGDIIVFSEEI